MVEEAQWGRRGADDREVIIYGLVRPSKKKAVIA